MKILRWILPVALVYGAFAYGQGGVETYTGKMMPAFTSKSFAGKTVSNTTLKGKPYILDFWATWCGPCKAASPTMQAIHKKYASKGLVVIGADILESKEGGKLAMKYPKEHGYTYTFTNGNEKLGEKLGITGIPCFVFVDKMGKIKAVRTGFKPDSPADFEKLAKSLL
jgi:cytochrome c biogenesis protein CcmG, thiol:disulfide interchange protein DsbE